MENPSEERRQHLRIYRNFILSYHEKGGSSPLYHISQVNNVSKGGLSFSSTHPLEKGAVVSIDLKAHFIKDSIILEGVVLGCAEKVPEMIYEIRLQFNEVPPEVMTVLEKIENYGKEQ